MTGVTILSTNVVTTSCPIINVVFSVLGITLVIGFLLFLSGFIFDNDEIGLTGGTILIFTAISFLACIPIDNATKVPDYNTYEVILDDSVSMNEFMNTYEVLEQRGQIYVVKEIEE